MSRQVLDSNLLDSMLQAKGIKVPNKPCCGRNRSNIKYSHYLAKLGYHGDFAIRVKGVITEMCHIP